MVVRIFIPYSASVFRLLNHPLPCCSMFELSNSTRKLSFLGYSSRLPRSLSLSKYRWKDASLGVYQAWLWEISLTVYQNTSTTLAFIGSDEFVLDQDPCQGWEMISDSLKWAVSMCSRNASASQSASPKSESEFEGHASHDVSSIVESW